MKVCGRPHGKTPHLPPCVCVSVCLEESGKQKHFTVGKPLHLHPASSLPLPVFWLFFPKSKISPLSTSTRLAEVYAGSKYIAVKLCVSSEQQPVAASVAIHHFSGPRPAGKRGRWGGGVGNPGQARSFVLAGSGTRMLADQT